MTHTEYSTVTPAPTQEEVQAAIHRAHRIRAEAIAAMAARISYSVRRVLRRLNNTTCAKRPTAETVSVGGAPGASADRPAATRTDQPSSALHAA